MESEHKEEGPLGGCENSPVSNKGGELWLSGRVVRGYILNVFGSSIQDLLSAGGMRTDGAMDPGFWLEQEGE